MHTKIVAVVSYSIIFLMNALCVSLAYVAKNIILFILCHNHKAMMRIKVFTVQS